MKNPEPITLCAPGKINLLLRITARRQDGFHELVSLFHAVPRVADTITMTAVEPEGLRMCCNVPDIPVDSGNLVVKAVELFCERMGIAPAWQIGLLKNIPAAAGMGGGSSDAGTVLRFLNRRYPGMSKEDLISLADEIGSDVPFFLEPGDAVVRGTGEILENLELLPPIPLLAVFPAFPVRAAWAYRHLQKMTPAEQAEHEIAELIKAWRQCDWEKTAALCANDFETALFAKFPLLNDLKKQLTGNGALCVHVSGSGPVLFAVFSDRKKLEYAAACCRNAVNTDAGIRVMEC